MASNPATGTGRFEMVFLQNQEIVDQEMVVESNPAPDPV
jgi:hypothetical protein